MAGLFRFSLRALLLVVAEIFGALLGGGVVDADLMAREIRGDLPLGSSRSRVEEVLRQRGIDFCYEGHSRTLTGLLRKVKGSTILVTRSVQLRFRFDEESTLRLIESETLYTGP